MTHVWNDDGVMQDQLRCTANECALRRAGPSASKIVVILSIAPQPPVARRHAQRNDSHTNFHGKALQGMASHNVCLIAVVPISSPQALSGPRKERERVPAGRVCRAAA